MNHKLLLLVLLAAWQASIGPIAVYAQNLGGNDPPDAGPPPENKAVPKARIRWPKPQKLPDQYRARDTDKDGQIGLYEWPRADYATFRRLDLNRDGFLTPQELTRVPSSKPAAPDVATKTAADTASSPAIVSDTPAGTATPSVVPANSTPAPPASNNAELAQQQWGILDKDKDGKVTEEEWGKSLFIRPKFRDAGVTVTFPLPRDEFIRLYQQVVVK